MNELDQLAFNAQSAKGAYALFLGSGVSRAAQVPTGWEILNDLIRKVAGLVNEKPSDSELPKWFWDHFQKQPTYSNVLEMVAPTPTERTLVVRSFFEADAGEDSLDNRMKPTKAHREIANLVKAGYFRVIVTTNFDRLMEQALNAVGVQPSIIANEDGVRGALPLIHSNCTVIKVNGDYLDSRLRNTDGELENYDSGMQQTLARVFEEFGVVFCGWSADWDHGLKSIIESTHTRRFTSYWCAKGPQTKAAEDIIAIRQAKCIPIRDADNFFTELREKLDVLAELNRPHPLSTSLAIANLKKLLADPNGKIRLHDFIISETQIVCGSLCDPILKNFSLHPSAPIALKRISDYESIVERLSKMFVHGSFWAIGDQTKPFIDAFQRVIDTSYGFTGGYDIWTRIGKFPATILFYSAGIAAVKSGNFELLNQIIGQTFSKKNDYDDEPKESLAHIYLDKTLPTDLTKTFPGLERHHTPSSDFFFERNFERFKEIVSSKDEYERLLDEFEYLIGLKYAELAPDIHQSQNIKTRWGPVGRFSWKESKDKDVIAQFTRDLIKHGANWKYLKNGFFRSDLTEIKIIKEQYDNFLKELRFRRF